MSMSMRGYQITFFTQQDRRHGHQPLSEWLTELARSLGIAGSTTTAGVEGIGQGGKLHSVHFFELADQPVEITMMVTDAQATRLFERLQTEVSDLFYVKTAVEYGRLGSESDAANRR